MNSDIDRAIGAIVDCYNNGGKLLTAGNGGSAADSAHICGEMLKGFMSKRPISKREKEKYQSCGDIGGILADKLQRSLPAIDLCAMQSILTAIINDQASELIYAQQLYALGNKGDVFWGISTSGNSRSIVAATIIAKERGLITVSMTGKKDSALSDISDITIRADSDCTPRVQEAHITIYHKICASVEQIIFDE